jgi:hypothetical protein
VVPKAQRAQIAAGSKSYYFSQFTLQFLFGFSFGELSYSNPNLLLPP